MPYTGDSTIVSCARDGKVNTSKYLVLKLHHSTNIMQ